MLLRSQLLMKLLVKAYNQVPTGVSSIGVHVRLVLLQSQLASVQGPAMTGQHSRASEHCMCLCFCQAALPVAKSMGKMCTAALSGRLAWQPRALETSVLLSGSPAFGQMQRA